MEKILIVAEATVLCAAIKKVVELFLDFEGITATYDDAIAKFLEEQPSVVIIWDHNEQYGPGRGAYNDIKSSASSTQKIIRCGFEKHNDDPDYIKAPFRLEEILQKIRT